MTTAASPLLSADPKATVIFEATKDGKLRASYAGWSDPHVFLPGEGVEVVNRGGKVQVFRTKIGLRADAVAAAAETLGQIPYEGMEHCEIAAALVAKLEAARLIHFSDKPFDPDGEENYGSMW